MALIDGAPMIAWSAAALERGCAAIAINASPDAQAAAFAAARGLTLLPDPPGFPAGPLSGVAAGLRWARTRGAAAIVTAPCDTPHLPDDFVERLLSAPPVLVVVAATSDGPHPLCALWRVEVLPALEAQLATGRHGAVRAFAAAQAGLSVPFDDARAFANINSEAELPSRGRA
jgi:molybdopterin-guanine dinucleotide biosynthesis protein A